jgi:hypothetical protein
VDPSKLGDPIACGRDFFAREILPGGQPRSNLPGRVNSETARIRQLFSSFNIHFVKVPESVHAFHVLYPLYLSDDSRSRFHHILFCSEATDFSHYQQHWLQRTKSEQKWAQSFIICHPEFLSPSGLSQLREIVKARVVPIPDMRAQPLLIISAIDFVDASDERYVTQFDEELVTLFRQATAALRPRDEKKSTTVSGVGKSHSVSRDAKQLFLDRQNCRVPRLAAGDRWHVRFSREMFRNCVRFWDELWQLFTMWYCLRDDRPPCCSRPTSPSTSRSRSRGRFAASTNFRFPSTRIAPTWSTR